METEQDLLNESIIIVPRYSDLSAASGLPLCTRLVRTRRRIRINGLPCTQRRAADDIGITIRTVRRIESGGYIPKSSNTVALIEMWIVRNQPREELEF